MVTEVKRVANTVKELLARGDIEAAINVLIAEGYGGHVTVGTLTSPIVGGGAGTAIAIDKPELALNIAANAVMIPTRISVQCEVGLIAGDSEVDEILIAVDTEKAVDGLNVTTAVNEQVYNMRGDHGNSLAGTVSAWSAITAAITAPVLTMELDRAQNFRDVQGAPASVHATQLSLVYEPKRPPYLAGADNKGAAVLVYFGGTVAVSGFVQAEFVTFPKLWLP